MKKKLLFLFLNLSLITFKNSAQIISTSLFASGKSGIQMTVFKDSLFFMDQNGHALYKTDGINAPTLVKTLPAYYYHGDYAANDRFFCFAESNGTSSFTVWKTDGTSAGTAQLKSSSSDRCGKFIVSVMDTLFFSGGDSIYYIRQNGTCKGICQVINGNIEEMFAYGDNLYYTLENGTNNGLYAYNIHTKTITTIINVPYAWGHITQRNGLLYFIAAQEQYLYEINANTFTYAVVDSNYTVKRIFGAIGNKILFYGSLQGSTNYELYSFDQGAGTVNLIKDIKPGSASSYNSGFYFQGITKLYFMADDGTNGVEFWVTDGTSGGTHMIANLATGANSTNMSNEFWHTGTIRNDVGFLIGDTLHTNNYSRYFITDGSSTWQQTVVVGGGTQSPGYWHRLHNKVYFTISYSNSTTLSIYKFNRNDIVTSSPIIYGLDNIGKQTVLYPNPSNGNVSINLGNEYSNIKVIVTDIQGRLVHSFEEKQNSIISINLQAPNGLYFISVLTDKNKFNFKMVKQ